MKKIIESEALHDLADEIINNVEWLETLDEDEGGDIDYYTPAIRQAAEELKELADLSQPADLENK